MRATDVKPASDGDTRSRIVAVAERHFRDIGYQKTTVADIARSLRMSPANVYRFFDSKRAINEAVVDRLIDELESKVGRIATDADRSAADRLRDIIRVMHHHSAGLFRDHPRMQEMIAAAMTESWSVCQHHIGRISALLAMVVAHGVGTGEFASDDPARTARCVHGAILRFCHPMLVVQPEAGFMPTLDEMTDFLVEALRKGAG